MVVIRTGPPLVLRKLARKTSVACVLRMILSTSPLVDIFRTINFTIKRHLTALCIILGEVWGSIIARIVLLRGTPFQGKHDNVMLLCVFLIPAASFILRIFVARVRDDKLDLFAQRAAAGQLNWCGLQLPARRVLAAQPRPALQCGFQCLHKYPKQWLYQWSQQRCCCVGPIAPNCRFPTPP